MKGTEKNIETPLDLLQYITHILGTVSQRDNKKVFGRRKFGHDSFDYNPGGKWPQADVSYDLEKGNPYNIGGDVKAMDIRIGDNLTLTISKTLPGYHPRGKTYLIAKLYGDGSETRIEVELDSLYPNKFKNPNLDILMYMWSIKYDLFEADEAAAQIADLIS